MANEGISRLFNLLNTGIFEIESFDMKEGKKEDKSVTYHNILHKYRDEIIIPAVALTETYDFFMFPKAKKIVKMSDGVICTVKSYEERHMCDFEDDIMRIYGCDVWSFVKKWHKYDPCMQSMIFIKINLIRNDESNTYDTAGK